MKDKYSLALLSVCVLILVSIASIQIYGISIIESSNNKEVLSIVSKCLIATLICTTVVIAVFLAKEKIGRETKRKAYIDVTGVQNKRSCMERMEYLDQQDDTLDIGLAIFDLNNLKIINDNNGHDKGDELIRSFAQLVQDTVKRKGFVGRFGGDEFILIAENCSYQQMNKWLNILDKLVEEYNQRSEIKLCFAKGFEISNREHYYMMEDLLKEADKKMYEDKRRMKIAKILGKTKMDENRKLEDVEILDECHGCCSQENECEIEKEYYKVIQNDQLTGLLTCESFLKKVSEILQNALPQKDYAIFCSDISDFRYINENYGYQVGNQVLKVFGEEITKCEGSLAVARVFSDNFASIIDVTGLPKQKVLANIQNMNFEIAKKIEMKYKRNYFVVNTGIYFVKGKTKKAEDIFHYSNTARKVAKDSYQHIYMYSDELENIEKSRAEILNSFHKALEKEEFQVYLQPKVRGKTGEISSAEALVRWITPDGKIRNPDDFIPLFEQTGDIIEMDYYVYNKVFKWLRQRIKTGKKIVPISLNVSQIHLKQLQGFIDYIKEIKQEYRIPSEFIVFEITESSYIQNINISKQMIDNLHSMGFKISMDDFGSGYSSLNSLKNLFFDEIKLDKEFLINGMNEEGKVILQQMILLIKKLNKSVVCEGVECEEEVKFLNNEYCDELQGYYFSKPLPMKQFEMLL